MIANLVTHRKVKKTESDAVTKAAILNMDPSEKREFVDSDASDGSGGEGAQNLNGMRATNTEAKPTSACNKHVVPESEFIVVSVFSPPNSICEVKKLPLEQVLPTWHLSTTLRRSSKTWCHNFRKPTFVGRGLADHSLVTTLVHLELNGLQS
jgi:hypothetical protein